MMITNIRSTEGYKQAAEKFIAGVTNPIEDLSCMIIAFASLSKEEQETNPGFIWECIGGLVACVTEQADVDTDEPPGFRDHVADGVFDQLWHRAIGDMSFGGLDQIDKADLAKHAYECADAMISARNGGEESE